jgi:predicted TIM-barrel fold metal-dependent hydrolase
MKIDVFCHITPPRFLAALEKKLPAKVCQQLPCKSIRTLADLPARFKMMESFADVLQILTVSSPPVEAFVEPELAVELSKIANDEMAELVVKYPDKFAGAVACLPMNDIDAALKETDRAIKELHLCGIQLFTEIMGKSLDAPEFMPLYEKMASYDLPIWLHPFYKNQISISDAREKSAAVPSERNQSEPMERAFQMTYGTPSAMTHLVYGQLFDKYPEIKFITHHCGSCVPYFAGRVEMVQKGYDISLSRNKTKSDFKKPFIDYFRMFYADTALHGNIPALMCGISFFGSNNVLFGTDMPFDAEMGAWSIRQTIESVTNLPLPERDKKLIWEDNTRRLLHLKASS